MPFLMAAAHPHLAAYLWTVITVTQPRDRQTPARQRITNQAFSIEAILRCARLVKPRSP
jgi:hypothetical protein